MAAQRNLRLTLCLAALCLVSHVRGQALTQDEWIANARAATPVQFNQKHVVTIDDTCGVSIKKGDLSTTGALGTAVPAVNLTAGVGVVLDICSGLTKTQTFKAPDLFKGAALWKVESVSGYAEGVQLIECKPSPNKCCSVYFVPVEVGNFEAEIETCTGKTVPFGITDSPTPIPGLVTADLIEMEHSTDATVDVEITLVYSPECGLGTPSTEGADGVYEGTGESAAGPPTPEGADGVFEGTGESGGAPTPESADGIEEGTGEGAGLSPPVPEGADGVFEGTGESAGPPSPEGSDGVFEGTGESGGPPTPEGADGVFEGTGESGGPPTPEGADGVFEGTGESGAPPTPEGADGVFEGTGESGAPPTPEGADGVFEGTGESGAPPAPEGAGGRRLFQASENDAAPTSNAKWFWSKGHTVNKNSLIDPDAPDPVEGAAEGEGGGRRLLSSRSLTQTTSVNKPMYDASVTPIELIVGRMYRISINLVRASQASYFAAPDLFLKSIVSHVEDSGAVIEFMQLSEVEVYPGAAYMIVYMQPMTVGDYSFSSVDDGSNGILGKIRVVPNTTPPSLSDSTKFPTTDISTAPCATANSPAPGAPTSVAPRGVVAGLFTLVGALVAMLLL